MIVKQARELKINSTFLGGDGWDSSEILKIAGDSINGSYATSHFSAEDQDPKVQNFLAAYNEKFGKAPSVLSALGYDAGNILVEAIKTKQAFPEQKEEREMTFEMARYLVESKKDTWHYEHEYWQKHWGKNE